MAHQLPVGAEPRISGVGLLNSYRLWHCLKAHINQIHKKELCFNLMFCACQFKQPYFFSVTCRSEIVIAYGALYDHSSKRPRITQFFAGKAPPADGKAAPPPMAGGADGKAGAPNPPASKAVPAVPPPVAAPTPKAGSTDARQFRRPWQLRRPRQPRRPLQPPRPSRRPWQPRQLPRPQATFLQCNSLLS